MNKPFKIIITLTLLLAAIRGVGVRGLRPLFSPMLCVGTLVATLSPTYALTPAGVIINNQATATYTDAGSQAQATSSNLVQTLVKEVVGAILTTPLTKAVAPSSTFYFPHFLTNNGNGPESYTMCIDNVTLAASNDFVFTTLELFEDANQDGLPDSGTPYTTVAIPSGSGLPVTAVCYQIPALNGGEAIQVVVEATTPAGIVPPETAQYSIQVFADTDVTVTDQNTDTGFVTDQPIVEVLKSISANQGISPSGPYTVTLTYRNTSALDAINLEITDQLPVDTISTPVNVGGMTYVSGSAVWNHNGNGDVALIDTESGVQNSGANVGEFCAYDVSCLTSPFAIDTIALKVASILAGEEGTLTFDVDIDAGLLDSDVLENIAEYKYQNDTGTVDIPAVAQEADGLLDSNAVTFVIINAVTAPAVVANDSDSSPLLGVDDADNLNNVISVAEIEQGAFATFDNYIWNTGDGIDSFDITVDNVLDREGNALPTPFPVGTIFQLFQPDGVIALLDTNGNSIPDTGPVNPGESFKVVLKVTPPATEVGDNSGNGWDVTKVATSFSDANISNAVTDRLLEITQSIIDLTNAEIYDTDCIDGDTDPNLPVDGDATPLATGCGALVFKGEGYPNGEATPVTSYIVEAGQTIYIPVWAHNVGEATDTFSLSYSSTNFSANTLPVGWSVRFYDSNGATNCANPGNIINSTGPLPRLTAAPANKFLACAELTIAGDVVTTGTEQSLFFRALSPTSGVFDIKHDGVTVTPAPLLAIEPGHFGQVGAGDTIDYPHIVSNYGNTAIECINITLLDELAGWSSAVFLDVDEDTEFSAGDVLLTDQVLQPGEQFKIIVQVTAPLVVDPNDVNHTTVTVNGTIDDNDANPATCTGIALTDLVTNDTSVAPTSVQIVKSQAPDANCDSVADSAFVLTEFQVLPAECVIYKLLATNFGSETAFTVVVNDDTPEYTVYSINAESCAAVDGTPAVCSPPSLAPVDGGTGNITWSISELLPSGTITTTFGVKVE